MARLACDSGGELEELRQRVADLESILCDVAQSGVEYTHESLGWVTVQIDKPTWAEVQDAARAKVGKVGP